MLRYQRNLVLDVFDYAGNKLVNLYDSNGHVDGQASDVVISSERNGWKEISFNLPEMMNGENGPERNFRADYLIADYRIRAIDDDGTDWYLISGPKISHNNFIHSWSVTAGHVSQLLKTKNIGLEFSDEEGNNVGTAAELLATILNGTGWEPGEVKEFLEDDGVSVKKRTMKASAGQGALRLIQTMCDLFEAKAVYHGDTQTVDILPMNPFTIDESTGLPDISSSKHVTELHYGSNVSNVTRTLNTENLVTRLYALGSFGDKVSGYCGIEECFHPVWHYRAEEAFEIGETGRFTYEEDGKQFHYNFTVTGQAIDVGDKLIYNGLDGASRMYIWNETKQRAYACKAGTSGSRFLTFEKQEDVQNWFSFVMDFSYYNEVGLLTDEALQTIARFQANAPALYQEISDKSAAFSDEATTLAETIGSVQFCRLAPKTITNSGGYTRIQLDTARYRRGVMYRTDYLERDIKWFEWHPASEIKDNGDAKDKVASVVYIIHNTNPITWERTFVKNVNDIPQYSPLRTYAIGDRVVYAGSHYLCRTAVTSPETFTSSHWNLIQDLEQESVTLWIPYGGNVSADDEIFLFETNNVNGLLGSYESADEAALDALDSATKIVTKGHRVYFSDATTDRGLPPVSAASIVDYAWWWRYYPEKTAESELYFCRPATGAWWGRVHLTADETPAYAAQRYFYDWKRGVVCAGVGGAWYQYDTTEEKRIAAMFGGVVNGGYTRDRYYQGLYQTYVYTASETLPIGNYAIGNGYGAYWLFQTDKQLNAGDTLTFDTTEGYIMQNVAGVESAIEVKQYKFDNVSYHAANMCAGVSFEKGSLNSSGVETDSTNYWGTQGAGWRSFYMPALDGLSYAFSSPVGNIVFYFYDANKRCLSSWTSVSSNGRFVTPGNTRYIRMTAADSRVSETNLHHVSHANALIADEKSYTILDNSQVAKSGLLKSIPEFVRKMKLYADDLYLDKLPAVQQAQETLDAYEGQMKAALGDIYREGKWQDKNYVDGDEKRLYDDAIENLSKVCKPAATYNISFLDLYTANQGMEYGESPYTTDLLWPDLDITDAVHLVDPQIHVDEWAYIDTLKKCYDQPWKTQITINTNLTLMNQHSFTDVIQNIATVAGEMNARQTKYDKAATLTNGKLMTEYLRGVIDANQLTLQGASSTWYTDPKGNIILENAERDAAVKLTGSGIGVANSKDEWGDWKWRTAIVGSGISADEITTGKLRSVLFETGSISADKLEAGVGGELDISANKTLRLYATVDGSQPAGTVLTAGSLIEIADDHINIASSGAINIQSGGDMNIESGAGLHVRSGGVFTMDSGNFTVDAQGNVTITGTINTVNGKIGGWVIGEHGLTAVSGQVGLGDGEASGYGDFIFWAGDSQPVSAAYWVKKNGDVHASNLDASGGTIGGWTIDGTARQLYSGSGAAYVALNSDPSNAYVIWAGNAEPGNAPLWFKKNGDGYLGGWTIDGTYKRLYAGSGSAYIELNANANNAYAIWAGHAAAASAPFSITKAGALKSTSGSIGGWTISGTSLTSNDGATGLAASGDWAYWAGNSTVDRAPFRVKRNGDVYINSLKVWNGSTWETVDFSGDFSKAVSLSSGGSWSGNSFTATIRLWGKINKSISISASATPTEVQASAYDKATVWVTYSVNGVVKSEEATNVHMEADMLLDTVWADAADAVGSEIKGQTFTVPYANGYGATTTIRNNTEITGIFKTDSGTSGKKAYISVVGRTTNYKEYNEYFEIDCEDIYKEGVEDGKASRNSEVAGLKATISAQEVTIAMLRAQLNSGGGN